MATNLAGGVCIGQLNACVVRAARLDSDCTPTGGADGGIITAGLATLTADPEIEEGTVFEPKNGCGDIMYTVTQADKIKRFNLTGEFLFFDYEMMALLFGGSTILGRAAGAYTGQVIGHAGDTGSLKGAYLYFELRQGETPLNPLYWLEKRKHAG